MNVMYKCPACGSRHNKPPGVPNFRCPNEQTILNHGNVFLEQIEDYNGPDSLYVDADGKTVSKGHIHTPGAMNQPVDQYLSETDDVDAAAFIDGRAEMDLTADLYPHDINDNTFQGSHASDGLDLSGLSQEQVEELNLKILSMRGTSIGDTIGPQGAVVEDAKGPVVAREGSADDPDPRPVLAGPGPSQAYVDDLTPAEKEEHENEQQLRDEYRELTGQKADGRWRLNRLQDEVNDARALQEMEEQEQYEAQMEEEKANAGNADGD